MCFIFYVCFVIYMLFENVNVIHPIFVMTKIPVSVNLQVYKFIQFNLVHDNACKYE